MNGYQKAQQLGLTGTTAEVVAQLKACGLTAEKITLGKLLFAMNEREMLTRLVRPADTGEKWSGSVINMILAVNAFGTDDQKVAVNKWFSHITNDRNELFDTTDPLIGGAFLQMAQAFGGQENMPSVADFQAIADLGGGWAYASLTVEQYEAQQAAAEAAEAKADLVEYLASLKESFDAKYNQCLSLISAGTVTTQGEVLSVVQLELEP